MRIPLSLWLLLGVALARPGGGGDEDGSVLIENPSDHIFKEPFDRPNLEDPWSLRGVSGSNSGSHRDSRPGAESPALPKPSTERSGGKGNIPPTKPKGPHQFSGFVDEAIKEFSPVDEKGKPIWKAERKSTEKPLPAKALLPIGFDGAGDDMLKPKKKLGFWYAEAGATGPKDPNSGGVYDGHIRFDMNVETVPLSFNEKILKLNCAGFVRSSFTLDVPFRSEADAIQASKTWGLETRGNSKPLYFAAVFPSGCMSRGSGVNEAVSFAKFISFARSKHTVAITMQHVPYDQAINEMEAFIGAAPPEVAADLVSNDMEVELERNGKKTTEAAILGTKTARRDGTKYHHHHREMIREKLVKLENHIKEMIRHVRKKIKKIFRQRTVTIREKSVSIDWEPKHNQMSEVFTGRKERALPQLADQLRVSCVECYAKSDMRYAGRIVWQPGRRSDASFWMQGPLEVQAQLGLVVRGIIELAHEIPLVEIPLQPYVFPGLVHVGPMFSIDIELGVELVGEMQMTIGANVKWDEMSTTVNLHRAPKHIVGYGWKPKFTPLLTIDGNFEVDAFAGISANLKFGVSVINGGFSFDVRAADRVTARAGFSVEGREFKWNHEEKKWSFSKPEGDASGLVAGSQECDGGLEIHTMIRNEVLLIAFHWWRKTLHRWNFRPRHHCVKFGNSAVHARANTLEFEKTPASDKSHDKIKQQIPEKPNYGDVIIKNPHHPNIALSVNVGAALGLMDPVFASERPFLNEGPTVLDTDAHDQDGNSIPGSYLVGFKSEIDDHGVSRLRTANGPDISSDAFFVSLTNGNNEDSPLKSSGEHGLKSSGEHESPEEHDDYPAIVAVTSRDDDESVLMVINCFYMDGRSRAFLAKDLDHATEFLTKPGRHHEEDSLRIRGGGVVEDCMVLSWQLSPLEVAGGEAPVDDIMMYF